METPTQAKMLDERPSNPLSITKNPYLFTTVQWGHTGFQLQDLCGTKAGQETHTHTQVTFPRL